MRGLYRTIDENVHRVYAGNMDDETSPATPHVPASPTSPPSSDRTAADRTAAASEARRLATDAKHATRLTERGYIVFRHDPKADPLPVDLGRELMRLMNAGMSTDALIVAYMGGWLGGAKETRVRLAEIREGEQT